ncbi:phage baseplate assembly protein V [Lysobacter soli]|uniref:phage baseplate assembly protein V n=1 Tax=Lysobacter soli TaxID=453783 RepID=UPI00209D02B7|nr:phage baseplate assembly protein V [Lysobacter soli]UTA53067.1 phage baseplate assembly protein V [Lysobacter soli]
MPHTSKPAPQRQYGKFRGVVVDNIDPLQLGRVLVQVPRVFDGDARWAMPCVPVAGHQSGLFLLPPVGAPVWVEFEQGDAELPIWVGGYWVDAAELPSFAHAGQAVAPAVLLQTPGRNALTVSDMPGPDGGRAASVAYRRVHRSERSGHHHQQRTRREHRAGRLDGDDQRWRADGGVTWAA